MDKILNEALFSEMDPFLSVERTLGHKNEGLAELEKKSIRLGADLKTQNEKMQLVSQLIKELETSTNSRFEKFHNQIQKLENQDQLLLQNFNAKLVQLSQKLSDRKILDQKTSELIDRQAQVLRSFEVRLNHMQNMMIEKDKQLRESQNLVSEMRAELARLKRL